jgi:predicted N-acyltransferase
MYAIKYATKINFLSENIRSKYKKPLFIKKPFTPAPKMLRLDMIKSVKEYLDMPIQYYASANLIISGDWDIECIYKFENNESQVELSDNLLIVWKTVLQLYKYNYNFTECDQYIKYCYEKKDKNIIKEQGIFLKNTFA